VYSQRFRRGYTYEYSDRLSRSPAFFALQDTCDQISTAFIFNQPRHLLESG
jgi:hypothetical protein